MSTNSPSATPSEDSKRRLSRGGRHAAQFHVRPRTRASRERDQNFWDRIAATKHWTNTLLRKIPSNTSLPLVDRRIHLRRGKRFVPFSVAAPFDAHPTQTTTPDAEVHTLRAEESEERVSLIIDGIGMMKREVFGSTHVSHDPASPETDDIGEE